MTTQASPIILGHRLGSGPDEPATSDLQQTVARVLGILSHRRWLFIIPLLTGMLISLGVGLVLPRRYALTAIFERRDDVVITRLVGGKTPYSFDTLRGSLNTDLTGRNAVAVAVEQLGLTRDYPRDANGKLTPEGRARKEALISHLVSSINIGVRKRSDFLDHIDVSYLGEEPELGAKVVNQLNRNYMAAMRVKVLDILHSAHDFFSKEAEKCKKKLIDIEGALLVEVVEHPGVAPSAPHLLDQQLASQTLSLEGLQQDRAEIQSKIDVRLEYLRELESRPDATPPPMGRTVPILPASIPNPKRAKLAGEMEAVRAKIADARAIEQMTDYHPKIVTLRRQLEKLRGEFEAEPERMANTIVTMPNSGNGVEVNLRETERRRVEMELKSFRENQARIDRRTEKHQSEIAYLEKERESLFERRQNYMRRQQDMQDVKNDLAIWKGQVDKIGRRLTAETQNRGMQFATVAGARCPSKPCWPALNRTFLVSLGIGLALGAAAAFLREILDRSFRDPRRVRQSLGIPVLETIGEIRVGIPSGWFSRRRLLPAVAAVQAVLVVGMGLLFYLSLEKPALYDALVARSASLWPG